MAQFRYDYKVDLDKGPVLASMGPLHYADRYGNIIRLSVFNGETPSDLSSGTIVGTVVRADGGTVSLTGTVSTSENNFCTIGLTAQCYVVPGPLKVFVRWDGTSGVKTTLYSGFGDVVETDTGVIGDTLVPTTVSSLISAINTATASIPADYSSLWTSFAPAYSTSYMYAPGQFVVYNGTLYECKNATSGAFVSADWRAVKALNAAVSEVGVRDCVDSFDNMIANRVYTITSDIDDPPSMAQNGSTGTTITINGNTYYENGQAQIIVRSDGETFSRILWNDEWTPWADLSNMDFSGISLFPRFGVVGDSFASGVIFPGGNHHYRLSWPQILARENGCIATNYSRGGMTTKSFITNTTWGLPQLEADITAGEGCGLYLLCLGINDSNEENTWGGLSILGSSSDVNASNPDANADTFWGNYCRIIAHIKAAAPDARICICTFKRIPTSATEAGYIPFNNAIRQIAAYMEIGLLDLERDAYFASSYYLNRMSGAHPVGPQYVGYAHAINRLLIKEIRENWYYFNGYTDGDDEGNRTSETENIKAEQISGDNYRIVID